MNEINNNLDLILEERNFVRTKHINRLLKRGEAYLKAGCPVHLAGAPGTGKTTLALELATNFNRPAVLIYGNEEFKSSDLLGNQQGFETERVVDNFVHSVHKIKERFEKSWVDERITLACKRGYTLIYDEFTRSSPEANNLLLSVLEEGVLQVAPVKGDTDFVKVHPDFKIIFTSNPEEYAGVYKSQDALKDRMITIELDHFDYETELEIVVSQTGLKKSEVESIVRLVRKYRRLNVVQKKPTIRASLLIAEVIKKNQLAVTKENEFFRDIVFDILQVNDNTKETLIEIFEKEFD